jgi:hypothetical protein
MDVIGNFIRERYVQGSDGTGGALGFCPVYKILFEAGSNTQEPAFRRGSFKANL